MSRAALRPESSWMPLRAVLATVQLTLPSIGKGASHLHALRAAEKVVLYPGGRLGQLDLLDADSELLQKMLHFQPGERQTDTDMGTKAESDMFVVSPLNVERMGILKYLLVPVGRRIDHHYG